MGHKVVLHVGPHKTGSTALQQAFHSSRELLLSKGVLYPTSGVFHLAHHGLVDFARQWPTTYAANDLRLEMGNQNLTLLSSENIVHLGGSALETLKHEIQADDIQVVYYLRRLPDLWYSHWQELVKHGQSLSFLEYLGFASSLAKSGRNMTIDQTEQLALLSKTFGKKNIKIVGYDDLQNRNVDFARHFLQNFLGIAPEQLLTTTKVVNASKSYWITEFLRLNNIIHLNETGAAPTAKLRIRILKDLANKQIGFIEQFGRAFDSKSMSVEIKNDSLGAKFYQMRVRNNFSECFVGDLDGILEAFENPTSKVVKVFDFPQVGSDALREDIYKYYCSLPGADRESVN